MKTIKQITHVFITAWSLVSLNPKQCHILCPSHAASVTTWIFIIIYLTLRMKTENNSLSHSNSLTMDLEFFMIWLQVLLSVFFWVTVLGSPLLMNTGRLHSVDMVQLNDNPAPVVVFFIANTELENQDYIFRSFHSSWEETSVKEHLRFTGLCHGGTWVSEATGDR